MAWEAEDAYLGNGDASPTPGDPASPAQGNPASRPPGQPAPPGHGPRAGVPEAPPLPASVYIKLLQCMAGAAGADKKRRGAAGGASVSGT